MAIFFSWIIFSILVGVLGSGRNIGFAVAFIFSLLLSPLIGLIITLVSPDKEKEKRNIQQLENAKRQTYLLEEIKNKQPQSSHNMLAEIEKLFHLKYSGAISEKEYEVMKSKIINKGDPNESHIDTLIPTFPIDRIENGSEIKNIYGTKKEWGKSMVILLLAIVGTFVLIIIMDKSCN